MGHASARLAAFVGISIAIAALVPGRGLAHTRLERSVPAKDAHLREVPGELRLRFSDAPELVFTRLRLLGPDSVEIALGDLRLDSARTVVAPIRGPLSAGTYTVIWQIAGADGHPIRGRYTFTIAPGAAGLATAERAPPDTTPAEAPASEPHHDPTSMPIGEGFDSESPLYVVVRWVTFTALLGVLGAVAFRFIVLTLVDRRAGEGRQHVIRDRAATRAATLGLVTAAVLGAAAIARLLAQSYAMHGPDAPLSGSMILAMLSRTVWGWGWLLQITAVIIAVVGFRLARNGRRLGWLLAALAAIVLAFTPALSGHAASTPRLTGLAVIADGLHVIGAAGWLGSLLVVLLAGISTALSLEMPERGLAVADVVNAFSPTALIFAGLTAATGVFTAWLHVGTWSALWQSDYGRLLLLKLIVLTVVAGTGAFNWRGVRPRLGDDVGTTRIRRSATVELAVAAVVLLVTAILVATPPPMDAVSMEP
jgi:putative copper export protein/methionine-rich copper-binding protein CopC